MPRLVPHYDWKEIVYRLRALRRESQAEFATVVGCSVSTVSKWEQGATATPAPRQQRRLEELAIAAGYPPSQWPELDAQQPLFPRSHQ